MTIGEASEDRDEMEDKTEVSVYGWAWVRLGVCRLRSMFAEAHEGDTWAMGTPGIEIMRRQVGVRNSRSYS